MKLFHKTIIVFFVCILLTICLAGCEKTNRGTQSTLPQSNSSVQASSDSSSFSTEELQQAEEQLPGLIYSLLATAFKKEAITDASLLKKTDFWQFVDVATLSDICHYSFGYREGLSEKDMGVGDSESKEVFSFISVQNINQIVEEFFGIKNFMTNDFLTESRWYNGELEGIVMPNGRGLSYQFSYKDLSINTNQDGSIHAELLLTSCDRYPVTGDYGRYELNFQLMRDGDRTFVRFQNSKPLSNTQSE